MPKALIDCDAFFASCEQAKNPALSGLPVAVAGPPGSRSVVSSASYPAKRLGIKAGMAPEEAIRLCPEVVFVQGDFNHYFSVHKQMEAKLQSFGYAVEAFSIDEFYMDFPTSYQNAEEILKGFSSWVEEKIGISVSAGIAPNRTLAKLASEIHKPKGLTVLLPSDLPERLDDLKVGRLLGIGKVTSAYLMKRGIHTLGQLRRCPDTILNQIGYSSRYINALLSGTDEDSSFLLLDEAKSISCRMTLSFDTCSVEFILHCLRFLSDKVSSRMRKQKLRSRTVAVIIRYDDFSTLRRAATFKESIRTSYDAYDRAIPVFLRHYEPGRKVRLIGLELTGFERDDAFVQPPILFEDIKRASLTLALDGIRSRHGNDSIRFASHSCIFGPQARDGV